MTDIIIIAVIAVIVALAGRYVYKAKKSGAKCIGCSSGSCGHSGKDCCCGENKVREYRRKTEDIFDLLENSDPLVEFDPDVFQILIEKIEITPEKFFFHLTNGLILKGAR